MASDTIWKMLGISLRVPSFLVDNKGEMIWRAIKIPDLLWYVACGWWNNIKMLGIFGISLCQSLKNSFVSTAFPAKQKSRKSRGHVSQVCQSYKKWLLISFIIKWSLLNPQISTHWWRRIEMFMTVITCFIWNEIGYGVTTEQIGSLSKLTRQEEAVTFKSPFSWRVNDVKGRLNSLGLESF